MDPFCKFFFLEVLPTGPWSILGEFDQGPPYDIQRWGHTLVEWWGLLCG